MFGTLLAQQIYALRTNNNESTSWPHALLYELVYCYAWALLTPVVLYLVRKFPLESRRLWRNLPVHLAAALTLAAVAQAMEISVLSAFHFSWFPRPPPANVGRSIYSARSITAPFCIGSWRWQAISLSIRGAITSSGCKNRNWKRNSPKRGCRTEGADAPAFPLQCIEFHSRTNT